MSKDSKTTETANNNKPDIVYRHSPCPDGASCELLIRDYFKPTKIEFCPYVNGGGKIKPEDVKGKDVWCVDKCPQLDELIQMAKVARSVRIIDHHKNADTEIVYDAIARKGFANVQMEPLPTENVVCASLMIWNLLQPTRSVPNWLISINKGDTDLISTRTEDEKAYHAGLTEVATPDAIEAASSDSKYSSILNRGRALIAERQKAVLTALKNVTTQTITLKTIPYRVVYVTAPHPSFISAITEQFFAKDDKQTDILCVKWIQSDNGMKQLSLRRPLTSKLDLSTIAKCYGGNGHAAASGIQNLHCLYSIQ